MTHFRNVLRVLAAVLVGTAVFGAPTQAQAGFAIRYSVDGGANFTTVTDNTGSNPGTMDISDSGFNALFSIFTSPEMSLSVLHVTLQKSTTYDVVIQASLSDIVTAPAPQTLDYFFTASTSQLTKTMQTWVDQDNVLFGKGNIPVGGDTGALGVPASGTTMFSTSTNYSLTTEIKFSGATDGELPRGASLDSNNSITATPAPPGLVLACSGLPMWGLGHWLRRRRNQTAQ